MVIEQFGKQKIYFDNLSDGKIKTVLQMIALIILLPLRDIEMLSPIVGKIFLYTGLAFLALATVMTIVSGINYLVKNKQVLKD